MTDAQENTSGSNQQTPETFTMEDVVKQVFIKSIFPNISGMLENMATEFNDKLAELRKMVEVLGTTQSSSTQTEYNNVKVLEGSVENPLGEQGLGVEMDRADKWQLVGITVGILSLAVTVLIWVDGVRYDGLNDKLDAMDMKVEAGQQITQSRFDSILTEIRASNQRLDDMKDYVDAKTEKR
jgi:hypothetical protein